MCTFFSWIFIMYTKNGDWFPFSHGNNFILFTFILLEKGSSYKPDILPILTAPSIPFTTHKRIIRFVSSAGVVTFCPWTDQWSLFGLSKIISCKKHKKNSILKYWVLENVPSIKEHIKSEYTADLGSKGSFVLKPHERHSQQCWHRNQNQHESWDHC